LRYGFNEAAPDGAVASEKNDDAPTMKQRLAIAIASLGLIGFGAWLIYPPLGFLSVGLLLWIDLTIDGFARVREP
jgi:hypothetical protein